MNSLDKKILLELIKNSRQTTISLAKNVRSSREVVAYRMKRLEEKGIIISYITRIDAHKLGYISASCFLSLKTTREEEFKQQLLEYPFAAWSGEFSGAWNFGVEIFGKNTEEIHGNFRILYDEFKDSIIDHRLTVHRRASMMYEKYLGLTVPPKKTSARVIDLDATDKNILKFLSKQARIDVVKLATLVGLSAPATAARMKKLEKQGVILQYTTFVDLSKLHLYQFSVFIRNQDVDERDKLLSHLEHHASVSFIIEYVGDPYVEFGVVTNDPYKVRTIVQQIEESFPDNRVVDMFLIQNDILPIYLPACVFE